MQILQIKEISLKILKIHLVIILTQDCLVINQVISVADCLEEIINNNVLLCLVLLIKIMETFLDNKFKEVNHLLEEIQSTSGLFGVKKQSNEKSFNGNNQPHIRKNDKIKRLNTKYNDN